MQPKPALLHRCCHLLFSLRTAAPSSLKMKGRANTLLKIKNIKLGVVPVPENMITVCVNVLRSVLQVSGCMCRKSVCVMCTAGSQTEDKAHRCRVTLTCTDSTRRHC